MAIEQAGASSPETVPYDVEMNNDVRNAMEEVANRTPETPPETKPAETVTEQPADKPVESKTDGERARDEQGRFAKVEATDEPKPEAAKPAEAKPAEQQALPLEQPEAKAAAPPTSWSIKAKAEWDKLPQVVRDDIAKREAEVSKGFAGYQSEYQGLKPFADRAKQQGQTLTQVVTNLVGAEDLLRRDPRGGFLHIASQMGMTQHQAAQHFASLAQDLGYAPSNGQAPANQNGSGGSLADQNAGADPRAFQQALDPVISPLMQRLQQLEQNLTQQTEAQKSQRLQSASSVIEQFRQDPKNRYYDNLEEEIGNLLQGGVVKRTGDLAADLASAYDMACRLNPEISEVLLNERIAKTAEDKARAAKEAAEKARQASKSVSGSPSPGNSGPASKRDPRMSYDEDLQNDVLAAVRSVGSRA